MKDNEIEVPPADLRLCEYETLNKEIQENSAKVYQVLTFCVVGTTGLLGYFLTDKFNANKPELAFLTLLPNLILLPSLRLIIASLHSTARIAGYLAVFYENDETDVRWQTGIQEYREKSNEPNGSDKDRPRKRPFKRALQSIFGGLSSTSLGISIYFGSNSWGSQGVFYRASYLALLIILVSLLINEFLELIREWSSKSFEIEKEYWTEYAKKIGKSNTHR